MIVTNASSLSTKGGAIKDLVPFFTSDVFYN